MDIKNKMRSLSNFSSKYKYIFIVIAIGMIFMLIPESKKTKGSVDSGEASVVATESLENQLEELLSMISGVGEVRVLLTTLYGEEMIYQTDNRGSGETINTTTVIVSDSSRNQNGLIQQRNPPVYRGAVVVCAGAERSDVRLAITNALMNVTGLRSDQISVLKMK